MIIPLPSNPILIVVHWKGGLILPTKLSMTRSLKVIGKTMIHFVSMEEDLQSWIIIVPFSELFKVSKLLNCKRTNYQILIQLGWTSLTESGPGDGTIRVLPLLKEPLSHILMRSLLDDIDEDQILGHQPGKLQKLDYDYQQKLWDSLVSLPKVHPGDTVWWHADLVHA